MAEVNRMRTEHLDDAIEDDKGWRRRGDFTSDDDWMNGVNAKPNSETQRRAKDRANAKLAAAGKGKDSGAGSTGGAA